MSILAPGLCIPQDTVTWEVGTRIVPILQMRILRPREAK